MNKEDELKLLLREEQNNAMNSYIEESSETNRLLRVLFWPISAIALIEIYWVMEDLFKW